MKIAGNYTFEATREEVWAAINDPEVLARTIPGCQRLEQVGANEFESTLKVGLGAVRGVYNGTVKIENQQPPESYDIHVAGKGNNGFLNGVGSVKLIADGVNSTLIEYEGDAQVGGQIASVGQRLLDGAAKQLIGQSLKALAAQIVDRRNPVAEPAAEEEVAAPAPAAAPIEAAAPAPTAAPPEAVAAPPPAAAPNFERRTIVVPEGHGLSEVDVARGVVEDFLKERPWAPWVAVAFLLGFLFGRRRS